MTMKRKWPTDIVFWNAFYLILFFCLVHLQFQVLLSPYAPLRRVVEG